MLNTVFVNNGIALYGKCISNNNVSRCSLRPVSICEGSMTSSSAEEWVGLDGDVLCSYRSGTSALSTEVLESALLTLEQISTRITVLALNASRNPEQSLRVRMLLGDLLADIRDCESELEIYTPLDA